MEIKEKLAKSVSYDSPTRDLASIKYIVIHYTAGNGDTALAEATYFANGNTRSAGAHFFVDQAGEVYKSINMNRSAWAVGGDQRSGDGGGAYYGKCTNYNSVSIELCDIATKDPSMKQIIACQELVEYIQDKCKNANTIIRHWDVNGKACPLRFIGKTNTNRWNNLKSFLKNDFELKVKVTESANIRTSASSDGKIVGNKDKGDEVTIVKIKGNWAKLKNPTSDGKTRWITVNKIKPIFGE